MKKAYTYSVRKQLPFILLIITLLAAVAVFKILYYAVFFKGDYNAGEIIFGIILPMAAIIILGSVVIFKPGHVKLSSVSWILGISCLIAEALGISGPLGFIYIAFYLAATAVYIMTVSGRIPNKLPVGIFTAAILIYRLAVEDAFISVPAGMGEWIAEASVFSAFAAVLAFEASLIKTELNVPYRRFGDRNDGRKIRTGDPIEGISPYIMVNRSGCQNAFQDKIEISEIEKYIRQKRSEGLKGFGIMHVIVAAYIRTVSEKPAINRFISGQRVYARDDLIEVNLDIKKEMRDDSPDTVVKFTFNPRNTANDVYNIIMDEIIKNKGDAGFSDVDVAAKILRYIPGLFMKFTIWFLKLLDYFGVLPRFLTKLSPFHGSLFITSMGSLGIPPVIHHLYDFGNIPSFLSFGMKYTENALQKDGTVEQEKYIDFTVTMDERIVDGFYFAGAFKVLKGYLKNPWLLDKTPEKIIRDID